MIRPSNCINLTVATNLCLSLYSFFKVQFLGPSVLARLPVLEGLSFCRIDVIVH